MGTEGRKMGGAKRSSGKGREGRGESRGSRACQVGSLEGLAGEEGAGSGGGEAASMLGGPVPPLVPSAARPPEACNMSLEKISR